MNWYKPIPCDNTVKNPLVCDYTNIEDYNFDEWSFLAGNEICNWNSNIIFQSKKKKNDGNPDDVLQNAEMLPIYSERLIKELQILEKKNIQYLPVKILKSDESCIRGFSIVNFLNHIEAFDFEKSDYNLFSDDFPNPNIRGKIAGIKKYVLKKNKLYGLNIFRLAEYEQAIFVSEKFKELFEKNKFTGYSFEKIELT